MTIETDFFDPPGFPATPTRVSPASTEPLEPHFPIRDERRALAKPAFDERQHYLDQRRRYG